MEHPDPNTLASVVPVLDPECRAMSSSNDSSPRKRGRPLEMQPQEVLRSIRALHLRGDLFRVHLRQPSLYARARRLFGTWAQALAQAGIDHAGTVHEARRRAAAGRRGRLMNGGSPD